MDDLYNKSLSYISKNFINKDYDNSNKEDDILIEPPIFKTNNYNCVTFIEMVLALHISGNFNELYENLKKIKYKNGNVDFLDRNHFMTTDWIPNNNWLLKDITKNISSNYKTKKVEIDKKSWIAKNHKKYYDYLENNNQLQKINNFDVISEDLAYVPSEDFINDKDFLKNLPKENIIFIVKDLKNIKEKIGTDLDVVHTGFLFKKNEYELIFRHASSVKNKIVDVDFKKYIEDSKNIQGIIILNLNDNFH